MSKFTVTVEFDNFSLEDFKGLQERACGEYPELKDDEEFEKWIVEYMQDSIQDLFEEF